MTSNSKEELTQMFQNKFWIGLIIITVGGLGGYFHHYFRQKNLKVPGFTFLKMHTYQCENFQQRVFEYRHNQSEMEFVLLPGGNLRRDSLYKDKIQSIVFKPFFISKKPVTRKIWTKIMKTTPWITSSQASPINIEEDLPATNMTWKEADEFCKKTGLELPSEAMWEYACRGTSKESYFWGKDFSKKNLYSHIFKEKTLQKLHKVGIKKTNVFGLFDMVDNGMEWCADWYHPTYEGAPKDGKGWLDRPDGSSATWKRVVRSFFASPTKDLQNSLNSSFRQGFLPKKRNQYIGFRCVFIYRPASLRAKER